MSEWIQSNYAAVVFMAFALGGLLGLLICALVEWWNARRAVRAEQQLEAHIRMRHGFHYAKRMGSLDKLAEGWKRL